MTSDDALRETDLYPPVKRFLEGQGYTVKAEVNNADVVALRGDDDPVIVELKTGFSLSLFHQAIARQSIKADIYVGVPHKTGRAFQTALKQNKVLCRRLGLGLLTIRIDDGLVAAHVDPAPFQPRYQQKKKTALLRAFARLEGDPNLGGTARRDRGVIITPYRQDSHKCLQYLAHHGPAKAAHVAHETGVARARTIMADNHYGWFIRVSRGVYDLSTDGQSAAADGR
ncbi:MAG: DUF2161 family putative PD-(D/E)XK-type phosphodiesterase [Pseudomonadota bacterium]